MSNMYQLVHGVSPATFFILPMLGKHADEYPRFRDCFVQRHSFQMKDDLPIMQPDEIVSMPDKIYVLTRLGGGNREAYAKEIEALRKSSYYEEDYDDRFDNTYATFVFRVPGKWREDYELVTSGQVERISQEYREELYRVYPKLKSKFDNLFDASDESQPRR